MSKGRNSIIYDSIEFDSQEEVQFYMLLRDLKRYGYVRDFTYHPEPFLLSPAVYHTVTTVSKTGKVIEKQRSVMRQHVYTSDFKVKVNILKFSNLIKEGKGSLKLLLNGDTFYVDTKGSYNRFGGDRLFEVHKKWVYDKYKVFVNKITPSDFFINIGYVPDELRWAKNRKTKTLRSKFIGLKPLSELGEASATPTKQNKQKININYLPK